MKTHEKSEDIELGVIGMRLPTNHRRRMSIVEKYLLEFKEQDIERYGLAVFSLLFVVYNIVYWTWLLVSSGYFSWEIDFDHNS